MAKQNFVPMWKRMGWAPPKASPVAQAMARRARRGTGMMRPPGLMGLGAVGPDPAVRMYQKNLNILGYKGANGKKLVEDGIWGDNTAWAQDAFNTAQGYADAPSTFQPALAAQAAELVSQRQSARGRAAAAAAAASAALPVIVQRGSPVPAKQAVTSPLLAKPPGLLDKVKAKWASLSTTQKALVGGGSVLVIVGVVAMTTGKRQRLAVAGLGGWRRLHAKKTGTRQNRRRPKGRR